MKKPSQTDARLNRRALILCAAAVALVCAVLCMPFCEFQSDLFTKRSGNTFVGDERYMEARAEVDAAVADIEAVVLDGDLRVAEDITERVNSKGETTSLIVFRVVHSVSYTGWQMVFSGLSSGRVLLLVPLAALFALVCALTGLSKKDEKTGIALRGLACWLALIALLLVPVYSMNNVYNLERQLITGISRGTADEALISSVSSLLYGAQAGESAQEWLATLTYQNTVWLWALVPALIALIVGCVLICKGELRQTLARGCLYAFVIVLCVVILYPYYVMLISGFRSNAETTDMYFTHLLPTRWVWSNLTDIINRGVPRFLLNSLALSLGATVVALGCGIPAAYAMARMSFRGKRVFLGFVIMSQMFSPVVLLVGISRLMSALSLNDSVVGLMLINAAFNQAFAIWLLRGTFVSISPEMEQAACIDGCGTVGSLVRVLLPMAAPGIVTTLIFVFINAWNEYTISTVLISTPANKPITVGITQFSSFNMIEWQYLFASALIATIPVVVLFMLIEKHLVGGLTSGGVKG